MNPNDAFRDRKLVDNLIKRINTAALPNRVYKIMEVCGTHTMAISRTGVRTLLPSNVELISGPGCPVCVTAQGEIDLFFDLVEQGASIVTFGDLLRVPGSNRQTLQKARAAGADVRVAYSPADAIRLAEEEPDKHFVFLGVGFETTAPAVAFVALEACKRDLDNISVLSFCKTMPEAISFILADKDLQVDGFLCPGHVTAVTGVGLYDPIISCGKAAVVAGFEPVELLDAVLEIINQTNTEKYSIANKYKRVVHNDGNPIARAVTDKVFRPVDAVWRGLGVLKGSGLDFRDEYAAFDARKVYNLKPKDIIDLKGCSCGGVLTGKTRPTECKLFANGCSPDNPIGPCMVSSEGTCAAYYKYNV